MLREFKAFIARGNVIDLAVAVVIGAAFGKIVTSLVEGILMPPIGLLLGKIDFSSLFVVLDSSKGVPVSIADAKAKAIPVLAYGAFINDVVTFVIIAVVVFLVVKAINRLKGEAKEPKAAVTKECQYCLSKVPLGARRCAFCTSDLEGA